MLQAEQKAGVTVSIVVLNWNRSELTRECLEHIDRHTTGIPYEVIVVDNGSTPDQASLARQFCRAHRARLIELNRNLYFGEANNIGAEAATGEFLLLLNNDAAVTAGYLQPLLDTLTRAYKAGAVGPKFIYPDGQLQEAGAYIRPDGWTVQHGKADAPARAISSGGPHIVDYCSAACLLMRRDVFLNAGGFDPLYDPAYFEDADLMLRLRAMGLFTYLCADVTVVHDENTTSRDVWQEQRRASVVAENHRKFFDRWGGYLGRRVFEDAAPPSFTPIPWTPSPTAALDRPIIVLEGPGLVRQGPEWRAVIRLAGRLAAHHVVFAADEACSRCRILTLAVRAGIVLGSFSVIRASDVKPQPGSTHIALALDAEEGLKLLSGSGPHLDLVRQELGSVGLARPQA